MIDLLLDGIYAAAAAVGFAAISNPSRRTFPYIAAIAATGHMVRFALMTWLDIGIVTASLIGASCIGVCAIRVAPHTRSVPETFSYPALLPMIPGMYACRWVQATWLMSTVTDNEPLFMHYCGLSISNGFTAMMVVCALFIGQIWPTQIWHRIVFSSTKND